MTIREDLHVHSTYSDGKDEPEEIVEEAIRLGLAKLGFSDHSCAFYDECSMKKERIEEYRSEIRFLKEKYRDRIEILLGIEQDYYSPEPVDGYDYVIGSVHYLKMDDGSFLPVDWKRQVLEDGAAQHFGGDMLSLVARYYETVSDLVSKTRCDIIGHFDLVMKFNEDGQLFDKHDGRYVDAWHNAADRLLATGRTFEINTGAISRGYRTLPYPDSEIIDYLVKKNAKMILSSDSHSKDTLAYAFDKYENLVI